MNKIKSVPVPPEYVVKDVGRDGTMTKGRWMSGVGQKKYIDMRGAGAATRGKKFLDK